MNDGMGNSVVKPRSRVCDMLYPVVHFVYFLQSSKYSDLFGPRNLVDGGRAVCERHLAPPLKVAVHVPAGGVDVRVGVHRLGVIPSENVAAET